MLLQEQTWLSIESLSKETPVLIPIAAIEQHGHHLPVFTDSLLLGEIVRRIEASMSSEVLITPLMWLGNSHHHMDFPGTMSAEPRVYLDLLAGFVENMLHHGFRRILMLNGHGGNDVPGKQAMFEVRQKYRSRSDLLLLFTTYWSLGTEPWREMPSIQQRDMGHACEWETSMIMKIAPHLVGDFAAAPVIEPGNPFRPASRAWITKDRSEIGHIGWPHLATAEKGEHLFESFTRDTQALIRRMIQWDGASWEG
jgi:creatinine amidohydrolase